MFLCFLVFSLCASTVKSQRINPPTSHPTTTTSTAEPTTTIPLDCPHLVATPDYPVAAGLTVELRCQTKIPSQNISWSRLPPHNQSWENVGSGNVLLLTEPKQSGTYRCEIRNDGRVECLSQTHVVYIVSISTAGEKLGKAAFALTISILIGIIAGLGWFCWGRSGNKLSGLDAPKKDAPPPPEVIPKNLPQTSDADGDVYMNYTSSTPAYTDLNPSNLPREDFYSTLS